METVAKVWDKVIKTLAGLAGAAAGLVGEWNVMLTVLAVMMVIDYVLGLIVAACGRSPKSETGALSSRAGFVGLAKKGVIILIVLAASLLDKALNTGSMVFQTAACFFYIANEGLSILENAALMGVPFPAGLKNALEALKTKGDGEKRVEDTPEKTE